MRISTPKIGPGAILAFTLLACLLLLGSGCLPKSQPNTSGSDGTRTITVYGFSIMKESLEKSIFPGFAAKWKQEHGEDVKFVSSFAGSETVTNQILQGVGADVAILSIERDVDRLQQAGFVNAAWHDLPNRGIVNKTPFLILVRKGNPKGIHDFSDLAKPGVKLIHPDPVSSGGAQWSVLAIYGSELIKSEKETGQRDTARALQLLKAVWKNVISTPGSAREARTQFETGYADALITYEIDALLMKKAGGNVDIVVPESTIFSEHPAVMIERNVTPDERPVVTAFIQYLWSDEAQRAFVQGYFRAASNDALNQGNTEFANIKWPFTVGDLGGWSKAYPDIIEHIFRDQVQKKQ
jgi:sulfate transport system substrate-binding protein